MQQESRPTGDVYIMKTTISVIEPTYVTALAILKHFSQASTSPVTRDIFLRCVLLFFGDKSLTTITVFIQSNPVAKGLTWENTSIVTYTDQSCGLILFADWSTVPQTIPAYSSHDDTQVTRLFVFQATSPTKSFAQRSSQYPEFKNKK